MVCRRLGFLEEKMEERQRGASINLTNISRGVGNRWG